jgi:hypothetical protein
MGLHHQTPVLQHGDAALEALQIVEGGTGRHQAHPVADAEGRGLAPPPGASGSQGAAGHGQRPTIRARSSRAPSQTCWLKWRP